MPELIYTQDDVDRLKEQWESDLFEVKTNETLRMVVKRLDESNNYKATIGKDVKEIKDEVKEVRGRLLNLEEAREAAAKQVKQELDKRQIAEDKKHQWYQDRFVRTGILVSMIWAIVNMLQGWGVHPLHLFG